MFNLSWMDDDGIYARSFATHAEREAYIKKLQAFNERLPAGSSYRARCFKIGQDDIDEIIKIQKDVESQLQELFSSSIPTKRPSSQKENAK